MKKKTHFMQSNFSRFVTYGLSEYFPNRLNTNVPSVYRAKKGITTTMSIVYKITYIFLPYTIKIKLSHGHDSFNSYTIISTHIANIQR